MSDFYNKYPYTDFHELNLDWVIERVKQLTEDWASTLTEWNNTEEEWHQLYDYVHDYFDNLDVQQEINNKIDQMILDGTFATIATPIIENQVIATTTAWLADHITQPTTPVVDTSLTISGAAADAEVTGLRIAHAEEVPSQLASVIGEQVPDWSIGAYNADGVTPSAALNRLRSDNFINLADLIDITVMTTGYRFYMYIFNSSFTLLGTLNWSTTSRSLGNILDSYASAAYAHIVISDTSNNNLNGDEYIHLRLRFYNSVVSRTDRLETKNNVPDGMILPSQGTLFPLDASFTHSNPIDIYKTSYGYTTDFDITSRKITATKTVYMAPDGDDTVNIGTQNSPYKTINKCIAEGADEIIMLSGVYYSNTNFAYPTQSISTPINLIGSGDVVVFFGGYTNHKSLPTAKIVFAAECYVENITFKGGYGVTVQSGNDLCAFNGCRFLNSTRNGLNMEGLGIYLYNCEASDNFLDGFNYHKDSSNVEPTGVVEIECKGFRNGNVTNRSSNASTIHDNGRIIRLRGKYGQCHGGVIADATAMSYNFDCIAYGSMNNTDGDDMYSCNFSALFGSEIWLINCMGYGSRYHLTGNGAAVINIDHTVDSSLIHLENTASVNVFTP